MSNKKLSSLLLEQKERITTFKEVDLGFDEKTAMQEAKRCLNCKSKPCVNGCPVNVDIPAFINLIKENDFTGAYQKIIETNNLPAICGRVCPQESQCENFCVRKNKGESVSIGKLERFVADIAMSNDKPIVNTKEKINKKVAIIGSGPAGLSCAADLAKMGFDVTIFEAFHVEGGVLTYGIPEFRLPKTIVQKEIKKLKDLGVKIIKNMVIGKVLTIDELLDSEGFGAVFIGSGAGLPNFMNIEGENLNGVYSANEFLTRINLMKAYKYPDYDTPVNVGKGVAVIGGGNVAMDAARCAVRLGAENVYIIYRRSLDEMPARLEEIHHAKEEGIVFKLLTNPIKIIGDENFCVKAIECVEMELGELDSTGRRKPKIKPDSNFTINVDNVIIAIGQSPNPLIISSTPDLKTQKWGGIVADDNLFKTSKEGVYAGGDAVTGAATVILAMGAGKKAAEAISKYLNSKLNSK